MVTTLQKWGNSLGLRIPSAVAKDANLASGSAVEIKLENETILIKPIRKARPKKIRLSDLLAGIRTANLHAEIESDHAKGKEAW